MEAENYCKSLLIERLNKLGFDNDSLTNLTRRELIPIYDKIILQHKLKNSSDYVITSPNSFEIDANEKIIKSSIKVIKTNFINSSKNKANSISSKYINSKSSNKSENGSVSEINATKAKDLHDKGLLQQKKEYNKSNNLLLNLNHENNPILIRNLNQINSYIPIDSILDVIEDFEEFENTEYEDYYENKLLMLGSLLSLSILYSFYVSIYKLSSYSYEEINSLIDVLLNNIVDYRVIGILLFLIIIIILIKKLTKS